MNNSSFLQADGRLAPPRHHWWTNWLPTLPQVREAIQLHFDPAADRANNHVWALSMRQGLGLVVAAALLAGLLPFIANTVIALRWGMPLPFVEVARSANAPDASPTIWRDALATATGLPPAVLPRPLAALLSTVGEWINWPLRWLTWWLVYGTATLLAAKVWGAPTTLQRFLAVTSYAAVPMILSGLGPIPCLGVVAQTLAAGWMAATYVTAVRAVTGLDWTRTLMAVLLPAAIASVLGIALLLAMASSLLRMIF